MASHIKKPVKSRRGSSDQEDLRSGRRRSEVRQDELANHWQPGRGASEISDAMAGLLLDQAEHFGQKIPLPYRQELEAVLGTSLAEIEVVTGPTTRDALQKLGARAACRGNTIFLDEPRPAVHIVAHEVFHALQARNSTDNHTANDTGIVEENSPAEREAAHLTGLIVEGRAGPREPTFSSTGQIQDYTAVLSPLDALAPPTYHPFMPEETIAAREIAWLREVEDYRLQDAEEQALVEVGDRPERASEEEAIETPEIDLEVEAPTEVESTAEPVETVETTEVESTTETETATVEARGDAFDVGEPEELDLATSLPDEVTLQEPERDESAISELDQAEDTAQMMDAFAKSPPSVKAARHESLTKQGEELVEKEAKEIEEDQTELKASLDGPQFTPHDDQVKSQKGALQDLDTGPVADVDESTPWTPSMVPVASALFGTLRNDQAVRPGRPVRLSDPDASGGREARDQEVKEELESVSTRAPDVDTSPGPPPKIPKEGPNRPEAVDEESVKRRDESRQGLESASEELADAPGPEIVEARTMEESFEPEALDKPTLQGAKEVEGVEEFNELNLEPELVGSFDEFEGPKMEESLDEAGQEAAKATSERDEKQAAAKEEAKATEREANEEAFNKQADALGDARGDIVEKKNDSFDKQREATLEKSEELDDERGDYRQKSVDKIEETEGDIDAKYAETEDEAKTKVEDGEKEARAERESTAEEAEDDSFWSRATSWLSDRLDSLKEAVAAVFDAVREAVNELIELAEGFAQELIERAANALKELADEFGEFAKGLVDDLIGDIFPELAEAFADLVDATVDAFHSAVDAAADYASERVAAAAQGLRDGINAALDAFEAGINAAFELADTLLSMDFSDIVMLVLSTAVRAAGIDPDTFMEYIEKAKDNVRAIIDDPAGFLANLGAAFTGGVELFIGDFAASLRAGIVDWLTDAMSGVDIVIPERFDLMGVLDLARQVMGLTWDYLKEKIAGVIGEENLERLLWVKDQIKLFIDEGWSGLFEQVMDRLSGVRDDLFAQIRDFLVVRILTQVVTRIASLLSPVGAVIQLVLTVWDFIQAALEVLSRIWSVVTSVIDALDKIVNGILDPAKEAVKSTLDRLLPIAIGVLARFLRLGGLAARVQGFIEGLRERVDQAVDALIERVKGFFTGGEEDDEGEEEETSPEDEGTHQRFVREAIEAMETPPAEVIDFQSFREQKRQEADRLKATYDPQLEEPVQMTIRFIEEAEDDQSIRFNVVVAPNNEEGDGESNNPAWEMDVLVTENISFLSTAHSTAQEPLEVGLSALAHASTTTAEDIERWKQIDEDEFKRAIENAIGSGERGINVRLLWEKPLLLESYNIGFASHAETNLAAGPLRTRLNNDGISEEQEIDADQYVRGQKANLHSNSGEFSQARDKIAGVVFNAARASSASQVVVDELIQQLRISDLVSQQLRDDVNESGIITFLENIIRGGTASWSEFEAYWNRAPDRDFMKGKFRNLRLNHHEWLPLSELRYVVELGANQNPVDKALVDKALEWLHFQNKVRTPTDEVVIVDFEFEFNREEYSGEGASGLPRPAVASPEDLVRHAGGDRNYMIAELELRQKPFHDVLRAIFIETKEAGPVEFARRLSADLHKLIWKPPTEEEDISKLEGARISRRLIARQTRNYETIEALLEDFVL